MIPRNVVDHGALYVFYQVSRLGGVNAAARELQVTQSAVSQRLASLERSIGRKLYGRIGNRVHLTEDGRKLYSSCRDAFSSARFERGGAQRIDIRNRFRERSGSAPSARRQGLPASSRRGVPPQAFRAWGSI